MTTEKLRSYRANRAELEEIALELAKCEVGIAVQSAAESPYSKHTATQSGLPPTPGIISLLERQSRLRALQREIERFVDGIDDGEIRLIIALRYITGSKPKPWQYIAMRLGYCSEHTPKNRLHNYLYNLHKNKR